ncbi:MAG: hypothetical protein AVDCRST_MAG36-1658, partial [uncultured Nocardioidaceae bacterium]
DPAEPRRLPAARHLDPGVRTLDRLLDRSRRADAGARAAGTRPGRRRQHGGGRGRAAQRRDAARQPPGGRAGRQGRRAQRDGGGRLPRRRGDGCRGAHRLGRRPGGGGAAQRGVLDGLPHLAPGLPHRRRPPRVAGTRDVPAGRLLPRRDARRPAPRRRADRRRRAAERLLARRRDLGRGRPAGGPDAGPGHRVPRTGAHRRPPVGPVRRARAPPGPGHPRRRRGRPGREPVPAHQPAAAVGRARRPVRRDHLAGLRHRCRGGRAAAVARRLADGHPGPDGGRRTRRAVDRGRLLPPALGHHGCRRDRGDGPHRRRERSRLRHRHDDGRRHRAHERPCAVPGRLATLRRRRQLGRAAAGGRPVGPGPARHRVLRPRWPDPGRHRLGRPLDAPARPPAGPQPTV